MPELAVNIAHPEVKSFPWNRSSSPQLAAAADDSAIAARMIEAGASSINLWNRAVIAAKPTRQDHVLLATQDVIHRLRIIQSEAKGLSVRPAILACTGARLALALASDGDLRDRRHLSGLTTAAGFHVYCGGIEAAIQRARAFAPYADALCYWALSMSREEAGHFARSVSAFHPKKDLGFGYCPNPHEPGPSEADHLRFAEMLAESGYRYYFYKQFNSIIFPPASELEPASGIASSIGSWIFTDDSAVGMPSH